MSWKATVEKHAAVDFKFFFCIVNIYRSTYSWIHWKKVVLTVLKTETSSGGTYGGVCGNSSPSPSPLCCATSHEKADDTNFSPTQCDLTVGQQSEACIPKPRLHISTQTQRHIQACKNTQALTCKQNTRNNTNTNKYTIDAKEGSSTFFCHWYDMYMHTNTVFVSWWSATSELVV